MGSVQKEFLKLATRQQFEQSNALFRIKCPVFYSITTGSGSGEVSEIFLSMGEAKVYYKVKGGPQQMIPEMALAYQNNCLVWIELGIEIVPGKVLARYQKIQEPAQPQTKQEEGGEEEGVVVFQEPSALVTGTCFSYRVETPDGRVIDDVLATKLSYRRKAISEAAGHQPQLPYRFIAYMPIPHWITADEAKGD